MPEGLYGFGILTQKERRERNALSPFRRFSFYAVMFRLGLAVAARLRQLPR
jgi:hypothetical protein